MYAIKWKKDVLPLSTAGDEFPGRLVYNADFYGIESDVSSAIVEGGQVRLSRREGNGSHPFWTGTNLVQKVTGTYLQDKTGPYNQPSDVRYLSVVEYDGQVAVAAPSEERLKVVQPICRSCDKYRGMTARYIVNCASKKCQTCSGVSVNHICPMGKWDSVLTEAKLMRQRHIRPETTDGTILSLIDADRGEWPNGFHKWSNVQSAYRFAMNVAAGVVIDISNGNGRGIVVVGGGKYFPSAYVAIRLIRDHGYNGPIELWMLPDEQFPEWQQKSLEDLDVTIRTPEKGSMRIEAGWELKVRAILESAYEEVIFFDADCYPSENPESYLDWPEYQKTGLVIWPDKPMKHEGDGSPGCAITEETCNILGIPYRKEWSKEAGVMLINRKRHAAAIWLADWINQHSDYYYQHLYGDKDTIALACWKLGDTYSMVPYQRKPMMPAAMHHNFKGRPIIVHRCNGKFTLGNSYFSMTRQFFGNYNANIPMEDEAFLHLQELRTFRNAYGLRIHAISVCINYADYLSEIAETNLPHLASWSIVTTRDDQKTLDLCKQYGLNPIISDRVHENKAAFNFGALRNDGIKRVRENHPNDWILLMDADVLLPGELYDRLESLDLDPSCIYGINRSGYTGIETQDHPISGFFQLFHASAQHLYSETFPSAGSCDIHFRSQWLEHNRHLLPLTAKHLGIPGKDWNGRISPSRISVPKIDIGKRVVVHRKGGAFGDTLLSAMFTQILRDHQIDAVWWDDRPEIRELIDLPMWDGRPEAEWRFEYESARPGPNFVRRALLNFARDLGLHDALRMTRNRVPLRYVDDPGCHGSDVALCLTGGDWSKYRWYPYIDELKRELFRSGISYWDVRDHDIKGQTVFNAIHKSEMYVGIDTGVTHAAASLNPNGIILQSGYNSPSDWNHDYPYEILSVPVPCAPCGLKEGCQYDHRCMKELSVSRVVSAIKENLSKTTRKAA